MITICSHCKRVISETLQKKDKEEKISHGICTQCLSVLEGKIRENQNCMISTPQGKSLSLKMKEHD